MPWVICHCSSLSGPLGGAPHTVHRRPRGLCSLRESPTSAKPLNVHLDLPMCLSSAGNAGGNVGRSLATYPAWNPILSAKSLDVQLWVEPKAKSRCMETDIMWVLHEFGRTHKARICLTMRNLHCPWFKSLGLGAPPSVIPRCCLKRFGVCW